VVLAAVVTVVGLVAVGWAVGSRLRTASASGGTAFGPQVAGTTLDRAGTEGVAGSSTSTRPSPPPVRRGVVSVFTPTTTTTTVAVAGSTPDPLGGALMVTLPADPTVAPEPTVVPTVAPPPPTSLPATTTTAPRLQRVTGVGDSIMLGAAEPLTEAVRRAVGAPIEINARIGRPFGEGIDVVRELVVEEAVGDAVILHLGTNGPIDETMVREMLDQFVGVRTVVVVNVRVPLGWEAGVNEVLAAVGPTYPNVRMVDWYAATADRPELFWADGVHLRPEGSDFYAELLAAALAG
jgi:hypothetical protein